MAFDTIGATWFVLDVSLRSLAAAAAVAVVLRLFRVRAAAVLHSAWSAVLVVMLLMPVLASVVPRLPVPVLTSAAGLFDGLPKAGDPLPFVAEPAPAVSVTETAPSPTISGSRQIGERLPASVTHADTSRGWWPLLLVGVYGAGVSVLVARLLCGSCHGSLSAVG